MDDDDPTEDNKMVLTSATDEFVLCQVSVFIVLLHSIMYVKYSKQTKHHYLKISKSKQILTQ